MKAALIPGKRQARATLGRWTRALLSLCMVGLPLEGGLAMGYAAGGHGSMGKELVGPLRERQREQRHLDTTGAKPERQARRAEWQARLVWLKALLFSGDDQHRAVWFAAPHLAVAPRAPFIAYRHGRVIDPSTYLHHASR